MFDFFAIIDRMRYISRWVLMRNVIPENIQEHSHNVAVIAHALATIENEKFGGNVDPDHIAVLALYHDAPEIITGDMPTPIKYSSDSFRKGYSQMEEKARTILLRRLPDYLQGTYRNILTEDDSNEWKYVKAADTISAYIKCLAEIRAGNSEFKVAEKSIREKIGRIEMRSVKVFVSDFLPAYSKTLDEQSSDGAIL